MFAQIILRVMRDGLLFVISLEHSVQAGYLLTFRQPLRSKTTLHRWLRQFPFLFQSPSYIRQRGLGEIQPVLEAHRMSRLVRRV